MTLLKETYTYLKNEPYTIYLIILLLLNLLFDALVSYIMVLISDGKFNLIIYYLIFSYAQNMFNPIIIQPLIIKLNISIQSKFYKNYTNLYDKLTFECKNLKIHSEFIENIRNAYHSMECVIDWGMPQFISLISAFISITITFLKKGLLKYLIIFLVIYTLLFFLIIKKKQEEYYKIQKKNQNKRTQNNTKEYLYSIPFQYKEISPEFMINIKENTLNSQLILELAWNKLLILNESLIDLISTILIYYCSIDIITFMLIIISMNKLSSAVQGLSNFITTYQRLTNEYNVFKNFWEKDLEFEKDFIKLSIKDYDIEIGNIEILRGDNYTIKKDSSFDKLKLSYGMKYLIQGPSGHGKSSFIKGLFGLIKTSFFDFSFGTGIQFYPKVSDYFQEIKEKMPSSKVSIRDYFKGEPDNELIKYYLLQSWNQDEYDRIIDSIKLNKDDDISTETDTLINIDTFEHPYDMLINEKLSGGQKSRLILWSRGYNVDTYKKEIIILDEPCPDVDFDSYIDNIKRFYNKYNDCTIFLIGHLCDCKREALDIKFDTELWIENGIISNNKNLYNYKRKALNTELCNCKKKVFESELWIDDGIIINKNNL